MKRIIICTILALACIAAVVSSFVFQNNLVFAKEHYENTYIERNMYTALHSHYGYGCGENSCEYCNGSQYKKHIEEFAYYETNSTYKDASSTSAIVLGVLFVVSCVVSFAAPLFFKKKKTAEQ